MWQYIVGAIIILLILKLFERKGKTLTTREKSLERRAIYVWLPLVAFLGSIALLYDVWFAATHSHFGRPTFLLALLAGIAIFMLAESLLVVWKHLMALIGFLRGLNER